MPAIRVRLTSVALALLLLLATAAWPWGNEGHMAINRVAAERLPTEVPEFLRHAADQLAFLGPEPDRWREKTEQALKDAQEPDHYIDLERVDGMTLPPDRYTFYRKLNEKREATPGKPDSLLPERVGLQPYITMEVYGRLVVAFREYRHALRDNRSPVFAEHNAIFYAGWLGHYVGDGANPLHTTVNYNGWTGANPNGYTTANTIHWKMEGLFVAANLKELPFANLVSPTPQKLNDPFQDYLAYLHQSYSLVEKCYQLEKEGAFDGAGTPASREFIEQRLAAGATMLRNLWYTAWFDSAQDPSPRVPPAVTTPGHTRSPKMPTAPKLGNTPPAQTGQ
jgi:hypothetical protein